MCGRGALYGRTEGCMRVSEGAHSTRASNAASPTTVPNEPSPLVFADIADPYSILPLTHHHRLEPEISESPTAAAASARPYSPGVVAALVSPLSASALEGGVLPPPSPSYCAHGCSHGCNCAPSSGSASSVGACRVHERVFSCPPPPLPVTSGSTDPAAHFFAGGDGEVALAGGDEEEVWAARDDTSEDLKEEGVKELLLRCVWLIIRTLPSSTPTLTQRGRACFT